MNVRKLMEAAWEGFALEDPSIADLDELVSEHGSPKVWRSDSLERLKAYVTAPAAGTQILTTIARHNGSYRDEACQAQPLLKDLSMLQLRVDAAISQILGEYARAGVYRVVRVKQKGDNDQLQQNDYESAISGRAKNSVKDHPIPHHISRRGDYQVLDWFHRLHLVEDPDSFEITVAYVQGEEQE